jgi:aminopeptidase N
VDGAVLVQFLHERHGKEKVHAVLLSEAADFWSAVEQVTGEDHAAMYESWTQWRTKL